MRRNTGIAFVVGLLFFALFAFLTLKGLAPPRRPTPNPPISAAQPLLPHVSVNYAKGQTEIHMLKTGDKYFANRSVAILKLTPEIAGLQFAFRDAAQPCSVTFLAPVGTTVYLLIDSDHGSAARQKGLRQLHQWLRRSGWKRVPHDTQIEPASQRAFLAVYRRSFTSLTRLTIAGVGTSGVVVAARQLALSDAAFTAELHPAPPAPPPSLAATPGFFVTLLNKPLGWFILIFALLIGFSLIYQILVALGLASRRHPRWATSLEASRANAGWRIPLITIDDDGTLIAETNSGTALVLSIGALAFIACTACLLVGNARLAIELFAAAVVIIVTALILQAIRVRQTLGSWEITPAHCLDLEIRQVVIAVANRGRPYMGWVCRALCEFQHAGQTYRVTPVGNGVGEKHFSSEDAAQKFMSAAVGSGGKCQLRVNPDNPRQTAFFSPTT
ncbi:MAG TPA: hypothetical protein VMD30_11925 [Tepidisphaeraceae bacterium]|nr:hypothetical protein [Tepidisphaeraceae bacterium]